MGMVSNSNAQNLAKTLGLNIQTVSWEDNARNKGSVWGPCISDMTLQVENHCMPVIRHPNYTDITWDVEMNKIPLIVGNEKKIEKKIKNENEKEKENENENENEKENEKEKENETENEKFKTISLRTYLSNFSSYMSSPPKDGKKINLISGGKGKIKDTHVIMSSQCCFLPIEKGKETSFNVALYNYQSRKKNPGVLAIICTSKGTSAQIIQGQQQKLLFNHNGFKADFVGQRLTDHRIEKNESIQGEMTKEEKQDNCIIVIQVPLKQKKMQPQKFSQAKVMYSMKNSLKKNKKKSKKKEKKSKEVDIESAIIKIQPKTEPICICGAVLVLMDQTETGYEKEAKIECDGCSKTVTIGTNLNDNKIWHCKKQVFRHKDGYDLCQQCGEKQLEFHEFDDIPADWKCQRNENFPIRVTLQYYKSTTNGVIDKSTMQSIKKMLDQSKKQADFIGSLVTKKTIRPTEPILKKDIPKSIMPIKYKKMAKIYQQLKQNGGENWEDFVKNFFEQQVGDSDLINLTTNEFKELIPLIGPRSRFQQWLKNKN